MVEREGIRGFAGEFDRRCRLKALVSTANRRTERVFLVGLELKSGMGGSHRESMEELVELAKTAGAEVVGEGHQKLEAPVPGTFIGSGKAAELGRMCRGMDVDTVIFDEELSPAQSRNLEGIFECKILDRTSLILDIFAQRARTREGKLQVELAQLQHLLPRLTGFWSHLSRQKGGIGMRGDGETQLEADRRRVEERIHKLGEELETVRRQRETQRTGRQRNLWPLASIVGYTNAGKSTLLNALTGAETLAEDKLFATLDPTTRRLRLPTNQSVLLSDTVGFIRKLPHRLVDAFRATLEEVTEADLLLHVVDASHEQAEEQILAVDSVLSEIGAGEKSTLMVFNKADRPGLEGVMARLTERFPTGVMISAKTGQGFEVLLDEIGRLLRPVRVQMNLLIPHASGACLARVHQVGQVLASSYVAEGSHLTVCLPPHSTAEFDRFRVDAPPTQPK